MTMSAPPAPLRALSSQLKPAQKRRTPRTSNQTVCSAGHRPMRTRPPVASCCGAMRRALPISLRAVWCPPLPPAMMYRSRRAAKKARTTEPLQKGSHDRCGSINGHNYELSYTEMLAMDAQKRPATFLRASHAASPNKEQMGPTSNRGPSIRRGALGPGCNDRGTQSGRTRATPQSIPGKMALRPLFPL